MSEEEKSSYKIFADDRERAVIPYFNNKCEVKRIDVADYQIYVKNILCALIERKTWSDLIASLLDGRKNNIYKLLAVSNNIFAANSETVTDDVKSTTSTTVANKIRIFYFIEGIYEESLKIPKNNLIAHLDHISWRDGVIIIYTESCKNTAERIIQLAHNISTCNILIDQVNVIKEVNGAGELKIKISLDPVKEILKCLSGVGSKVVKTLIDAQLDMPNLLKYMLLDPKKLESDIAAIVIAGNSKNSIGKSKAAKICESLRALLTGDEILAKSILECIPGISAKSATFIIKTPLFGDILRGYITVNEIAAIPKSTKTKIGAKCAKLIEKYICVKN
jgi:ERCC4-type nuclease